CLTSIDWPVGKGNGIRAAFDEAAMRHGDFAMASAAGQLQIDENGICLRAAIGIGGLDGVPLAVAELGQQLIGQRIDEPIARELAPWAVQQTEPGAGLHAAAACRRQLAVVMLARVLLSAALSRPNGTTLSSIHE